MLQNRSGAAAPALGPAIEVHDVWLSLEGTRVLEAVDLTVQRGEFLGLIGPNGAGKTVLLKVLLGLLRPQRGTVRMLGKPPREARGEVGYVPQHVEFDRRFPVRVLDVVLMGRLAKRGRFTRRAEAERRTAREALERVGLAGAAGRQIGALSGGELQRVMVARALAMRAEVLLLDEPTANLDSRAAAGFYDLLDRLAGSVTLVLVAHDIGVIYRHVQSVACLNRRLHYHASGELTQEMLEETYGFPVDVLVHGHRHRWLEPHDRGPRR